MLLEKNRILGFIGGGNMAEALVRGLLAAGAVKADQMIVADPSAERRALLSKRYTVKTTESNEDVAKESAVLVIAVKPGLVPQVGERIGALGDKSQLVISIAAGVPLSVLADGWGSKALARAMPNTPSLIGLGAAGVCFRKTDDEQRALVRGLLEAVCTSVVEMDKEEQLDAVTGLSGSGPAYVFEFIEALADGGVLMGLSREQALSLAASTVEGAARMVRENGDHPALLKDRVASPGGTTIAGLAALEKRAFRSAAIEAVRAATTRSRELGERAKKKH